MGLSYTTTKQVETKHELRVPSKWGMFTPRGNKRITKIATEAKERIEKLCAESRFNRASKPDVRSELVRMVKKYIRLHGTKTYPESSDTAVRNAVASFVERLAEASGAYDSFDAHGLWYEIRNEASQQIRN